MSKLKELRERREKSKEEILKGIIFNLKEVVGRDNEVAPDYFGRLFFDVLTLTSISKDDFERYSSYIIQDFEKRCKGVKNDGTK